VTPKNKCVDCPARADSQRSIIITGGFAWKLNVILCGVAATFLAVGGLVAWTVLRIDALEIRVRAAAIDDARRVAYTVASETRSR
jgi:hypothetical protein